MMEAFSKAREYCAVDLWVKASNLHSGQELVSASPSRGSSHAAWGEQVSNAPCK